MVRHCERSAHFVILTNHLRECRTHGVVQRVTVTWPASGLETVLEDVSRNGTIIVREGEDGFVQDRSLAAPSGY